MSDLFKQLSQYGIIPVVVIDHSEDAAPLANALTAGGLSVAEVTMRTPAALDSLREMRKAQPNMLLGAGTVLFPKQAEEAIAAGASFIVSPGLDVSTARYCAQAGVPYLPGIATPTEIIAALAQGLEYIKFFPAEENGGTTMLKSFKSPFGKVKFMPTGGITPDNLGSYLALPNVYCCGGSFIAPGKLINEHKFDEITNVTKNAIKNMLSFRIKHLGINSANETSAKTTSESFHSLFGFVERETPGAIFVNEQIEVMKQPGAGSKGHIAVQTPNVDRAYFHLSQEGVEFDESTIRRNEAGEVVFVYLKGEIDGFAVHLIN